MINKSIYNITGDLTLIKLMLKNHLNKEVKVIGHCLFRDLNFDTNTNGFTYEPYFVGTRKYVAYEVQGRDDLVINKLLKNNNLALILGKKSMKYSFKIGESKVTKNVGELDLSKKDDLEFINNLISSN